jgi:hypothetical protein
LQEHCNKVAAAMHQGENLRGDSGSQDVLSPKDAADKSPYHLEGLR